MPEAPEWFDRELKTIDPNFFAWWNSQYEYWEIKSDLTAMAGRKIEIRPGKDLELRNKYPTIDVAWELDQRVLNDLRRRRWEFEQRKPGYTADDYVKEVRARQAESRAKRRRLAIEMMAEGAIKIDEANRQSKTQFDLSGSFRKREAAN
jgi:hypothetical protein